MTDERTKTEAERIADQDVTRLHSAFRAAAFHRRGETALRVESLASVRAMLESWSGTPWDQERYDAALTRLREKVGDALKD